MPERSQEVSKHRAQRKDRHIEVTGCPSAAASNAQPDAIVSDESDEGFSLFFAETEPRLRRALVAACGAARGSEATTEAMTYAWEHWTRVRDMTSPIGYLFRVGRSRTRLRRRRPPLFPEPRTDDTPWIEPGLGRALASLTVKQRLAVVLIHGFEFSYREAADLMKVSPSTVENHLERGMKKLRSSLGGSTYE